MSHPAAKYTQEQLDIAILKNTNEGILKSLDRIETEIKTQISEIRTEIRSEIRTHFHWTTGLIFGLYAISLSALLSMVAKAYGWF